jgi:hypothetical protein
VDVIGRPIEIWLFARNDGRGRLVFERALTDALLIAPEGDGGILPDRPGARSDALRAVLARARLPSRRQDGGAADGSGIDSGLSYNFFDDYDPNIGEDVESNLIGLSAGPNAHSYVAGDPANFSDAGSGAEQFS